MFHWYLFISCVSSSTFPAALSDLKFQVPIVMLFLARSDFGQWAELFCTGTGQPRPPQSPAALQAGSGEPKARVLTWHLSMGA